MQDITNHVQVIYKKKKIPYRTVTLEDTANDIIRESSVVLKGAYQSKVLKTEFLNKRNKSAR